MVVVPETDVETLDVLYIAEDDALAEMYRLKLELDGYWVRVVDLDNAVAETRARRPDIIFLELPAGRPDRLGILEDLRRAARRPNLPAVILAASRSQELRNQGANLSASDYVVRISSPDGVPATRLQQAADTELP
ncbi:MAG: response regulator [Chloroflexi bacterium]|nr:MAG: response regulator [Chloroflexota bacterium]